MARCISFPRSLKGGLVLALAAIVSGIAFATQILEVSSTSLTSYLAGRTNVQDVRPLHRQRGVNLDGSLREGGAFPLAIAGNPFERAWRGDAKNNGIQLDTGAWSPTEIDLSLPAPGFRWNVGRSYNVLQDDSGRFDSDGYQGANWNQLSQPELVLYDAVSDSDDVLYLVWGADRYAEFRRTGNGSDLYKGKNGAAGIIEFVADGGGADTFIYHDQAGYEYTFFSFELAAAPCEGQLWKIRDPAANEAYVGSLTKASALTNGYDGSGRIKYAFDSADRRYTYTYSTVDSIDRLTQVKAETKTSGSWASPSGVAEVGKVEYGYYANGDSNGDSGDLRTVKVTLPLSDSGINEIRVQYYRYWEGSYNASTNPGYPHHLKLFLDWEGARKYDYADSTFDDDFLTETTDNLKPYAAAYFEYDSSHRVDLAWFSGQCGCGGAGTGTHEYRYETNGSYSDASGYDTESSSDFSGLSTIAKWARRTSVERPDGSWLTQYFDETGQPLSRLITDADPANTGPAPAMWVDRVLRDPNGEVAVVCTPASFDSYTHASGAMTSQSGAGLIWRHYRAPSGNDTGFLADIKYMKGLSGSEYLERSYTWDTTTAQKQIAGSGVYVRRPLMTGDRVYSQAVTSGTTGSYLTSFSHTTYSGVSQPLAVETITKTNPAVSTGNNGSNGTTTLKTHLRKDGREDFVGRTDGTDRVIEYKEYTKGLMTKHVSDADTTSLSPPTGLSHSIPAGSPLNQTTSSTYDEQGRPDTTTAPLPSLRVSKVYHTILKDRRLVTIDVSKYASGSPPTWYGPAAYTVRNHAGKVEVQGVIAYSSAGTAVSQASLIDETDDDPITAVDSGTLAQMRTHHYDEAGTELEEERGYFAIPGSEPGSEGTHYDATRYGYDEMGRRRRVKEAHGTITRIVYDALSRQTARWIGTCDNSWAGGEAGTDNMVKIEETIFDAGVAGGNSYVTTRTRYVEDSNTNKRETSYLNDLRGNVLLATNPQAPHLFYKYDNMDRVVAVGGFSSTGSIAAASDDPTTETANRVSLSQNFYDELGREWKEQWHKIDVSDGSDDDNLQTLSWYDAYGRLVKRDGAQLEKYFYDRLDRQTHHFTLVNDNDGGYGDADDVSGDIVVVEDQTTYDATHSLMQARIERLHDDYGGGETTGALDTNGDGDSLLYTAANLEGRIQISAMWYDSLDRLWDRVEYGTNGGSNFDRDGLSVPSRSDTALRTTYTYNDDGTLKEVEDPKGLKTRTEYDALGRRTKVIANYVDGTPGGGTYADEDQTVSYGYTDGLQTSITADLPSPETDQVTSYSFGTTKGASAGDSKIATGNLLHIATYPDSGGGGDVVTFAYNAQSQQIWKQDQSGNIIETDFDTAGRETHRRLSTLDSDFDGAVKRISRTYNSRGLPELVTQYDNATVGSGSIVDQVKYSYESWAQLSNFEQDRNSAVGAGGSVDDYEVAYTWEKATTGRNTLRRASLTLPSGNVLDYKYRSTANLHDAEVSRVTQLAEGATALVTYNYNGLDTVVGTTLDEPDVMSKQFGSSSGSYPDLDRFNRVTTSKWTKDLATDRDFYHVDLAYDRNSNITSAEDQVHSGFDVLYTNDNLNRLVRADEGTLSGGSITSRKRDQQWTLNQTGNWELDKVDLNGDGDFVDANELNDDRTHNAVNELTARDTDDNGSDNFSFAYDEAGNLTDDGESYKYEWDAFYRLRKVKNRSNNALVAEYKYNGLGYRISIHEDTDSDGDVDGSDKWYHHAFDERWRWVATYRESDTSPKEEYLHHAAGLDGLGTGSYIDLVIFRDRDINSGWTSAADGVMEERLYYCQNWRADVSAVVTDTGQMKEWDKYSAYGVPFGLPGGDADSDGDCDASDVSQVNTWVLSGPYDVRGDIDLDGDVDHTDSSTLSGSYSGTTLGRGVLSAAGVSSRVGSAGHYYLAVAHGYDVRRRVATPTLGRWLSRDPLGYHEGASLMEYVNGQPIKRNDQNGLQSTPTQVSSRDNPVAPCQELLDDYINKNPDKKGDVAGLTSCYNGKPLKCAYPDELQKKYPGIDKDSLNALVRCVKQHEDIHGDQQCKCASPATGLADPLVDLSSPKNESEAVSAEILCLGIVELPSNAKYTEHRKNYLCNKWSNLTKGKHHLGCP